MESNEKDIQKDNSITKFLEELDNKLEKLDNKKIKYTKIFTGIIIKEPQENWDSSQLIFFNKNFIVIYL